MYCILREEDEDFPPMCLPELLLLNVCCACLTASLKVSFWKCKNLGKDQRKTLNNYHIDNQHNLGDPNLHLYLFNNPNQSKKEKVWGFSEKGN